jgi:hypothetical protein
VRIRSCGFFNLVQPFLLHPPFRHNLSLSRRTPDHPGTDRRTHSGDMHEERDQSVVSDTSTADVVEFERPLDRSQAGIASSIFNLINVIVGGMSSRRGISSVLQCVAGSGGDTVADIAVGWWVVGGFVSIPFAYNNAGYIGETIILVVCACLSALSANLLLRYVCIPYTGMHAKCVWRAEVRWQSN